MHDVKGNYGQGVTGKAKAPRSAKGLLSLLKQADTGFRCKRGLALLTKAKRTQSGAKGD